MCDAIIEKSSNDDKFHNRYGTGYGKPKFPLLKELPDTVVDLVGPDSMGFFRTLGLDSSFLNEDIGNWENSPSYCKAKSVVNHLKVVNDAAERGVKLGYDFLEEAQKEDRWQNILQVVENERKRVPNLRKPKKKSKHWYLTF